MEEFNTVINEKPAGRLDKTGVVILVLSLIVSIIFFIIGGSYIHKKNNPEDGNGNIYYGSLSWDDYSTYSHESGKEYRLSFSSGSRYMAYFYLDGCYPPSLKTTKGESVSLFLASSNSFYHDGYYYDSCYYAYLDSYTSYELWVTSQYSSIRVALSESSPY